MVGFEHGEVRGWLFDIDGTLLLGDRALEGAADAIARVRHDERPFRLVTNTTRRPCREIAAVLRDAGIDVSAGDILTPAAIARRRIVGSGRHRARLLVAEGALEDFSGVEAAPAGEPADWVVVGDLGRDFTWERLNDAFRTLIGGAALLALQKNRFWHAGDAGLTIDAGAFVSALEYSAGVDAAVVGKPSPGFFSEALAALGLDASKVAMVGDDVAADVAGARAAGCRGVLVRTGKFRQQDLDAVDAQPDLVVNSIADLFAERAT